MMPEAEIHRHIQSLSTDIANLNTALAEVKAEVRVVKHDQANTQMVVTNFSLRLDKFEDKIGGKMDELTRQISGINSKQERGLGFFAGVAFILTGCLGVLFAAGKLLFGNHP